MREVVGGLLLVAGCAVILFGTYASTPWLVLAVVVGTVILGCGYAVLAASDRSGRHRI